MEYASNYPTDTSRQAATNPDVSRHVATDDDYISIKEVQALFLERGREITERSLQRSCARKHFDGQKLLTAEGEKWFVKRSSVLSRIAELEEFDRLRASRRASTSRDTSLPVDPDNATYFTDDRERHATSTVVSQPPVAEVTSHATEADVPRPDAASRDASRQSDETVQQQMMTGLSERERELYELLITNYRDQIENLKGDKTMLQDDKRMLVEQLLAKDKQIEHFFNSERDTKKLFGSLQNIMTYLWPGSKRKEPSEELPQAYGPVVRDMPDGLDDHREGSGR